ncbi:hypothetical protein JCM11251_006935 [Rhodosporidiobolus azoricus]
MPAVHSPCLAPSYAAGNSRPSRRHVPYAPPPRKSSLAPDSALATLGAFYIAWPKGKRDPAPLCCPVQKQSLVKRFGEAQIGYMSAPPPPESLPEPVSKPQSQPSLPSLAGVPLPPLPPLPSPCAVSPSVSPPAFTSSAPTPPLTTTSTPPDFSSSFNSASPVSNTPSQPDANAIPSPSLDACALLEEALRFDRASSFDTTTTLSLSLPYSFSSIPDASSHPPPFIVPHRLPSIPEIKVEDEEDDDFAANEALWSAGEDGGLLYHGTDAESEASWAAW